MKLRRDYSVVGAGFSRAARAKPASAGAFLLPALLLAALAACAPRTLAPPAQPATLAHPEFVYPAVPATLRATPEAERIEFGWRYLQSGDLRSASREFETALRDRPAFPPAHAGEGYVALADRDPSAAVRAFDAALRATPDYVPALVGRGQALAELRRDEEAIAAFEAALAADPSLTTPRLRVQALRFRQVERTIETAREAASANRLAEAREAYGRAILASPDSAFLYRELGDVERRAGDTDAALDLYRRAAERDAFDAESHVRIGEILEGRQDLAGAEEAYRRAAAIDPGPEATARLAGLEARVRDAALPEQFGAIAQSAQITRGDLAALIGTRLEPVLQDAWQQPVILTDVQDHWAEPWIVAAARTGVLAPFRNNQFEPAMPIRRMDLADAVRELVTLLAEDDAALRERLADPPPVTDVSPSHLSYPAVVAAVASGVMELTDGRFDVTRPVSGAEAIRTIERIQTLAGR